MNINIAIILKNTIKNIGLKSILQEHFGIEPKCYNCAPENCNDIYDLIITDATSFSENLDYMIPRKKKCIFIRETSNQSKDSISENNKIENIINDIGNIIDAFKKNAPEEKDELSTREIEVLKLIANGHTNKEMADNLNISINTILTHRKNITSKLGIRSVSGLTFYAMMHGYVNN